MPHEKDTSSMITTGARNLTVLDDTGDYAGAAQTFGQDRDTEMKAIDNVLNPDADVATLTREELVTVMLSKGMVWCNGRCQRFRHFSEFSVDVKNPDRLMCHSFCKECRSAMRVRDYHAQHPDAAHWKRRKKRRRTR